jgi:phage/plasmid primase, P4 family, C-terminal domain
MLPITYNPEATCPAFTRFLDDIFLEDEALVTLLQEIAGYILANTTKAEKAVLLLGNGANGKSTLLFILSELVGQDNVSTVPLSDLGKPFQRSQIVDKNLNVSGETDSRYIETSAFKSIVSGDLMQFERKHENVFNARPFCKLISGANRLPKSNDLSDGFRRRWLILPISAEFVDTPKTSVQRPIDRDIKEKLLRELDGIFIFALDGLKKLKANAFKFTVPTKVERLIREYSRSINPYQDFVLTCIEVPEGGKSHVLNKTLCGVFALFCRERGWANYANQSNGKILAELKYALRGEAIPFEIGKSGGNRYIAGIAIKNQSKWD